MASIPIHVDTDIGGDIDDLCALAMLLGWPGAEIVAVTTVIEDRGRRAGYARHVLDLAGCDDVPIAAGIDIASGVYPYAPAHHPEGPYWGAAPPARPGPADAAIALLRDSIERGAVILALGPYSNLAELERRHPGLLARANLVLMGGCIHPPRSGFPPWTYEMDYNIQMDVAAAERVMAASRPLIVPIEVTVETAVRTAHLPVLDAGGPLARLVARQARASGGEERSIQAYAAPFPSVPDDILNFLHDPLAAAIAAGWRESVRIETTRLSWRRRSADLQGVVDPRGREADLVTAVDGPAFGKVWLDAVIDAG